MADKFWNTFVLEYLPTLVRRTKWFKHTKPLQLDDVVLIVDENFKRNTWPKGIVVNVFKDKRGHVRSAEIRTVLGTFLRRPVSKLAVLDVRDGSAQREGVQVKLSDSDSVNGKENVGHH